MDSHVEGQMVSSMQKHPRLDVAMKKFRQPETCYAIVTGEADYEKSQKYNNWSIYLN